PYPLLCSCQGTAGQNFRASLSDRPVSGGALSVALRARACFGLRSRSVPPAPLPGPLRVLRIPDAGVVVAPLHPHVLAADCVSWRGSSGGEPPRPSRMPSGGAEGIPHLPRFACADGAPPSSPSLTASPPQTRV